jgi:hypothetical protein
MGCGARKAKTIARPKDYYTFMYDSGVKHLIANNQFDEDIL